MIHQQDVIASLKWHTSVRCKKLYIDMHEELWAQKNDSIYRKSGDFTTNSFYNSSLSMAAPRITSPF